MKIWKIMLISVSLVFLIAVSSWAGDVYIKRGRQPVYEEYKTERYIEDGKTRGYGGVRAVEKTTIKRRYKKDTNRSRKRQRCTDEKGRRKSCN